MNISETIAEELNIRKSQVESTLKLIDDGNTIPFIARYRKEATGGLSDEILRELDERLKYLRNLEQRKKEVIKSIEGQGKLTDEILEKLEISKTMSEVEDIYRPYKQKKRTRATIAKENGLEPLANIIYKQEEKGDIYTIAKGYVNSEKNINSIEDAIQGAMDIIAENISDNAEYRKQIKFFCYTDGLIETKAINPEIKTNYNMYYNFSEKLNRIPSHRILAINRGEKEEILKVKIEKRVDIITDFIKKMLLKIPKVNMQKFLRNV